MTDQQKTDLKAAVALLLPSGIGTIRAVELRSALYQIIDAADSDADGLQTAIDGKKFRYEQWIAGAWKVGEFAITADRKKIFTPKADIGNSSVEPSADNQYWKLVFEDTGGTTPEQLEAELAKYLPLHNPTGATVDWDAENGYLNFSQYGYEVFKAFYRDAVFRGDAQIQLASSNLHYNFLGDTGNFPATPGDVTQNTVVVKRIIGGVDTRVGMSAFITDTEGYVRLWVISGNTKVSFDIKADGLYLNGEKLALGQSSGTDHFKGTYTTLSALQAAHPTAAAGNSADVDAGAGTDVVRYIWDVSDAKWVKGGGTTTSTGSGQNRAAAEAFSSLITFDKNKVLFLGGTGNAAFTQNYTFGNIGTCVDDSYAIIIVTGNGSNTCSIDSPGGWKKENNGVFNPASGMKNVIRMHYINENNKFYTITQPN